MASSRPPQDLAAGDRPQHHPLVAAAAAASLLAILYLPRPLLPLLLSPASVSSLLLLLSLLRLGSPPPPSSLPPSPEAAPQQPPPPERLAPVLAVEFASWAPKGRALEVIHEEFEAVWEAEEMGLVWTSESDSESGDDEAEEMIELELEEDNLIEIDIWRCR